MIKSHASVIARVGGAAVSLPPLNALRAFEATARHLSFKKAADELCVTQGAISRHVMRLEAALGLKLFTRHHRKIELTPEGLRYGREISDAFGAIARATANCTAIVDDAILKVKLPPTCAIRWFVPRLAQFYARHPDISVQILTSHEPLELGRDAADVAIQYNRTESEALRCEPLFSGLLVPVCSRDLASRGRGIHAPDDLARHVLLKSVLRPRDWPRWFAMVGTPQDLAPERELVLENASLTYEGAEKGIGVALAQVAFIEEELRAGRLVVPVARPLPDPGYFLVTPRDRARLRKVRLFRAWLLEEAVTAQSAVTSFAA
jgi:LysR family glycine cleavage system transcriptional activator